MYLHRRMSGLKKCSLQMTLKPVFSSIWISLSSVKVLIGLEDHWSQEKKYKEWARKMTGHMSTVRILKLRIWRDCYNWWWKDCGYDQRTLFAEKWLQRLKISFQWIINMKLEIPKNSILLLWCYTSPGNQHHALHRRFLDWLFF